MCFVNGKPDKSNLKEEITVGMPQFGETPLIFSFKVDHNNLEHQCEIHFLLT